MIIARPGKRLIEPLACRVDAWDAATTGQVCAGRKGATTMGDLRWRRGVPAVVAGLILGSLAVVQVAGSSAAATSARNTGWRVIRTIGPDNTDLESIAAFRHHVPWLGGMVYQPTAGQFYAAVYQLTSGPLHQVPLTTRLGTGLNGLSATSPANVWASVPGVPGGQVYRLTRHGWHPYSFAIGADDILLAPVVTTGPKNTWVLTEDFNTGIAYGYRFNGSRWHRQKLPAAADANSSSGYVTASASNNIWALTFTGSRPASMRYNGSTWQIFKFPAKLGPAAAALGPRRSRRSLAGGRQRGGYRSADSALLARQVVEVHRSNGQGQADRDRTADAHSGHPFRARDRDYCWLRRVNRRYSRDQVRAITG
jgi:hypothetical protein